MKQVCICQKRFPNSLPFDHVKYAIQSWFPICNEFLNFPPKQKPLNIHLKLLNLCSSRVDHRIISLIRVQNIWLKTCEQCFQHLHTQGPEAKKTWSMNFKSGRRWRMVIHDPPAVASSFIRILFLLAVFARSKNSGSEKKSDTFHHITNPKFRTLNRIFYQGSAPSILGTLSLKPKPHHNVSWLHYRWAKQQRSMMIWGVRRCLCEEISFLKHRYVVIPVPCLTKMPQYFFNEFRNETFKLKHLFAYLCFNSPTSLWYCNTQIVLWNPKQRVACFQIIASIQHQSSTWNLFQRLVVWLGRFGWSIQR